MEYLVHCKLSSSSVARQHSLLAIRDARLLATLVCLPLGIFGCARRHPALTLGAVRQPELRAEIAGMVAADQAVQAQIAARMQAGQPVGPVDFARRDSVFQRNFDRMRAILAAYGWPGRALVGEEGSHGAWLLLQHADQDTLLQRTALVRLEEAVRAGDASRSDLAYLTDRVRVAEGRPQVYGTQLQYDSRGCASPRTSEEPERLDAHRAAAGLEPMTAYLQRTMELLGRAEQCRVPK
jgi:hypothetical protein